MTVQQSEALTGQRRFTAYGTQLEIGWDLSDWLPPGRDTAKSLSVRALDDIASGFELADETALLSSHGRELSLATNRTLNFSEPRQPWRFTVGEVMRFEWRGGGTEIGYAPLEQATQPVMAFWLIHIFLPLFFTLERWCEFIHASSVEINGQAILLLAPSHGGKSTLTEFLLKQGHALVSDDKAAIRYEGGRPLAVPSHPNHRPYRRYEDLGLRAEWFVESPLPVGKAFVLHRVDPGAPAQIRPLKGHRQFAQMLPSSLFQFDFMAAQRLESYARLANAIDVYELDVPWNLERLGEAYEALLKGK